MWVFACGMQRAGSTLQFQIAAHIVEAAGAGQRLPWMPPDAVARLLSDEPPPADLRILKTHHYQDAFGALFRRGAASGLYIFRDIRDVVVSIMRKEAKTFAPKWVQFRVGRNLEWFAHWTAQPRVLVSQYETVMDDLPTEVGRIAAHLGLALDRAACEGIAAQYTLDRQRARIEQARARDDLRATHADGLKMDRASLLHTNHIQSGAVEGWRAALTAEQVAFVEDIAGDWLRANGYRLMGEESA